VTNISSSDANSQTVTRPSSSTSRSLRFVGLVVGEDRVLGVEHVGSDPDLHVHVVEVDRDAVEDRAVVVAIEQPADLAALLGAVVEVATAADRRPVAPDLQDAADGHRTLMRAVVGPRPAKRQRQVLPPQRPGLHQPAVAGRDAFQNQDALPRVRERFAAGGRDVGGGGRRRPVAGRDADANLRHLNPPSGASARPIPPATPVEA
jgi:hypothetical protein